MLWEIVGRYAEITVFLVWSDSDVAGWANWYKALHCGWISSRGLWHPASRYACLTLSCGIFDAFLVLGQIGLEGYEVPCDVGRFIYYRWYVLVVFWYESWNLRYVEVSIFRQELIHLSQDSCVLVLWVYTIWLYLNGRLRLMVQIGCRPWVRNFPPIYLNTHIKLIYGREYL